MKILTTKDVNKMNLPPEIKKICKHFINKLDHMKFEIVGNFELTYLRFMQHTAEYKKEREKRRKK